MMKRLLPIVLLLISSATLAESGAYRVEVIVFRNLEVVTEADISGELRSFSQYPDLQEVQQDSDPLTASTAEQSPEPSGDLPGLVRSDLPDDLQVLKLKSTSMDEVWRRLRSSKVYRPLVFTAWEQNRIDYYPPIRIHDQNIIDTQLRPPTHIMVADLAGRDPLAAYRSVFYQLDGSIQLRRSRFLHLFLDLEFREEQVNSANEPDFFASNDDQPNTVTRSGSQPVNGVFALRQNRQVRTGQLQYFDTPYFGALVLVSAISAD